MAHGELAAIVTAMRNRSRQPETFNEEEAMSDDGSQSRGYDESLKNSPRLFKYEQRFPVLMISVVGRQHARIYYACMDFPHLIIRQSRLYSFEDGRTAPLEFFSRMLQSHPL
ncbi:hypothetical protein BDV18DRAFT_156030 [Aspergillus unguis]